MCMFDFDMKKNEKRALTPFFVAIVVANAEKNILLSRLKSN